MSGCAFQGCPNSPTEEQQITVDLGDEWEPGVRIADEARRHEVIVRLCQVHAPLLRTGMPYSSPPIDPALLREATDWARQRRLPSD